MQSIRIILSACQRQIGKLATVASQTNNRVIFCLNNNLTHQYWQRKTRCCDCCSRMRAHRASSIESYDSDGSGRPTLCKHTRRSRCRVPPQSTGSFRSDILCQIVTWECRDKKEQVLVFSMELHQAPMGRPKRGRCANSKRGGSGEREKKKNRRRHAQW
jgi:hypothetical protein